MKKTLLSVAFLFAAFAGANAQQTISFESSEGFIVGDINGQNSEWSSTGIQSGGNVPGQVISDELASDGSNSLKLTAVAAYGGQQNPIIGAFYDPTTEINGEEYTISFDFRSDLQSNSSSDFQFTAFSSELLPGEDPDYIYPLNIVRMRYNGAIAVYKRNAEGEPALQVVDDLTWTVNTWHNFKIVANSTNVEYYLDNVLFETVETIRTTAIDQIRLVHDNYGGNIYIDNFKINNETASLEDFKNSKFSLYPNPANNVINISNSTDVIENVTITDMNGRIVKQVTLGVNQGEINISDLTQGVYILNATSNGKSFTEKIVKK